jgi:protein-S-isoprenylcysteine O-methyltransferase Ste14
MYPVLIVMYLRLARREERDAVREFGDRYRRYQAEVPAWIPRRRSRQT